MNMISVLVTNLTRAALDLTVAKCEGKQVTIYLPNNYPNIVRENNINYHPSTNWDQGGSIIEREKIDTSSTSSSVWIAQKWNYADDNADHSEEFCGESLLEAALRCYVASKLGDKVEVPLQLVSALPLDVLNKLWADLGDIPTVFEGEHVDEIEQEFLHFPVGTHRESIWRWFESMNEKFSVGEIMSGSHQAVVS